MKETLLYRNGDLIGKIPYSGDDKIDSKSAKKLLAEKGLLNLSNELDSIMRQAHSFEQATRILESKALTVPFIVNGCFCIELFFKALHIKYNSKKSGHELKKLYELLPTEARNSLEDRFIDFQFGSLGNALNNLNNSFIEWRYMHENGETSVISTGMILAIIDTLHAEFQ